MRRENWVDIVIAVGGAQTLLAALVLGASLLGIGPSTDHNIDDRIRLAQILAFGVSGAFLVLGGAHDRRATLLGGVLLLIGANFAEPVLRDLHGSLEGAPELAVGLLAFTRAHAFLPLLLWEFAERFPRSLASRRTTALLRLGTRVSLAAGIALAFVTFSIDFHLLAPSVESRLEILDPKNDMSLYWVLVFGLMLPAFFVMPLKARLSPTSERKRLRFFLTCALAGSVLPALVVVLAPLVPPLGDFLETEVGRRWVRVGLQPFIFSIALTTAYSVRVHRVMEVRAFVRQLAQYALARSTLTLLASLPFVALGWYLFESRHLSVSAVLSGPRALVLFAIASVGTLGLRVRRRAQTWVDRSFFREQFDARRILAELPDKLRDARSIDDLSRQLTAEIDRALHLDTVDLMLRDDQAGELRSPLRRARPLPLSSQLSQLVDGARRPVRVDLEGETEHLGGLSDPERDWLADTGFRQLLPLLGSTGSLLGLIGLGGKRSELPFTSEDLRLLSAVAASGTLALENRLMLGGGPGVADDELDRAARECSRCGGVEPAKREHCTRCGTELGESPLPYLLAGKFQLELRIGSGAAGVVFRAVDVSLDRTVALKTLPRVSAEDALRLRREARTMASVTHPNLAMIYGAEAWHGTPVLVMEFLGGGTLEAKLTRDTLSIPQALEIGMALASVLERIHAAGVLHRDIKPSNVAYTEGGVPKLLDFGLSEWLSLVGRRPEQPGAPVGRRASGASSTGFAGTPLYMSPEAIWGETSDVSVDLWSTCVVLFEAIARRHPFERDSWQDTLSAILSGSAPDLRRYRPSCPAGIADFFENALNPDRSRRPRSATDLRAQLASLR